MFQNIFISSRLKKILNNKNYQIANSRAIKKSQKKIVSYLSKEIQAYYKDNRIKQKEIKKDITPFFRDDTLNIIIGRKFHKASFRGSKQLGRFVARGTQYKNAVTYQNKKTNKTIKRKSKNIGVGGVVCIEDKKQRK